MKAEHASIQKSCFGRPMYIFSEKGSVWKMISVVVKYPNTKIKIHLAPNKPVLQVAS